MPERIDNIKQRFSSDKMNARLQTIIAPFGALADEILARAPDEPETEKALRALENSKDSAILAAIGKEEKRLKP